MTGVQTCALPISIAGLIQASHDLQDRGLTSSVGADHADLGAREKAHGDIVEDDLVTDGLASLDHLINKLRHVTPFGWFGARSRTRIHTYGSDPTWGSEPPTGTQASVILISGRYFPAFAPSASHKGYALVTDA